MSHYNKAIPESALGARVFVYFNLHSGMWSVKNTETGKVLGHAARVTLSHVGFKVSQAGRQRVLREQRKNVHAGLIGLLVGWDSVASDVSNPEEWTPAYYNPYKVSQFVKADDHGVQLFAAHAAVMGANRRVMVRNPSTLTYAH